MSNEELTRKLIDAVFEEKTSETKRLLKLGANPNGRVAARPLPLLMAVEHRNETLVRVLVANGADVNGQSESGESALHIAVDIDADSAWQNRREPDTEMTRLMLELGTDPNLKNNDGKTALDWAIDYKHEEAIALLKSRMGLAK